MGTQARALGASLEERLVGAITGLIGSRGGFEAVLSRSTLEPF
jgi:hypothetical protein